MMRSFSEEIEGHEVVRDGETVGRVAAVRDGTAYVDPAPAFSADVAAVLGGDNGTEGDEAAYRLPVEAVAAVEPDRIRLRTETEEAR